MLLTNFFDYFTSYYIDLKYGINYPLQMLIFSLVITLSLNTLKWDVKGIILRIVDLIFTFILQIFVFNTWEYLLGSHNYINYISWPVVLLVHSFFFTDDPYLERLAKCMTLAIFMFLIPQFTNNLVNFTGNPMANNFKFWTLAIATILGAIWTSIFIYTQQTKREKVKMNIFSFLILLFILGFSITLIVTDNPERSNDLNVISHIFLYFLLLIVSLASYYLFFVVNQYHSEAYENNILAMRLEATKRMIALSNDNLESLRRLRHDTKNRYQFMKTLLEKNDFDKLEEFVSEMKDADNKVQSIADTHNDVLNKLIDKEKQWAVSMNINMIVSSTDLSEHSLDEQYLNEIFKQLINFLILSYEFDSKEYLKEDFSYHGKSLILHLSFPVKEEYIDQKFQLGSLLDDNLVEKTLENDIIYLTFKF